MAKGQTLSTTRIEAFSDAVFAIAGTLLVLQLQLPHLPADPTDAELWNGLGQVAPSYFSLVLSFVVIGRYWIAHHWMFSRIAKSDGGLQTMNLLFLLTVVALPFPTEVLGNYGNLAAAAIFYAVSISLIGLTAGLLWWYAVKKKLLKPNVDQVTITNSYRRSFAVPVIFLGSIPIIAWVGVGIGELCWLLLFFAGFTLKKGRAWAS
jgi:uncharacterized membrane protein